MLVYPEIIEANLKEAISIAGGAKILRPHIKTHKTPEIVAMHLEKGITRFKCATLREAEMLGECGASDVLIAYPQVGPAPQKLCEFIGRFPSTQFSCVADCQTHLRALETAASEAGCQIPVWIDVDCGMHRTGIAADDPQTKTLIEELLSSKVLSYAGLHVYDGHNHQPLAKDRTESVRNLLNPVIALLYELKKRNIETPNVVCGGTPTFPIYATLRDEAWATEFHLELSPGTSVLSDYNYLNDHEDLRGFQPATLLMARVISKGAPNQITLDLGNKAVASDPPAGKRCSFPTLEDAREITHSEEHLVLETAAASELAVGDIVYAIPAHICPTVALHETMQVVREHQVVERWHVAARRRIYL